MHTLSFNLPCLRPSEHPCAVAVGIGLVLGLYYIKPGCSDSDFVFIEVGVLDESVIHQ
jgi:hypothetical protein